MLVTLRGCHLLDSLVVVSVEACKKLVRFSGEALCDGHYARPIGATKSNSSRARREGRQVVRPGQVQELVVSTHVGECDLWVTTSKRTDSNLGACLNGDVACCQAREPQEKNHLVKIVLPIGL